MKRRRYALLVTPMPSFRMRDCRVDSFRPRRAAAPSGPAATQLLFLRVARICSPLRLFQRFENVAGRDCRNQADEDCKAGNQSLRRVTPTATSSFRPGGNNKCEIVASSPASLAIANSIPPAPVPVPSARRTPADRLGFFFRRQLSEIWQQTVDRHGYTSASKRPGRAS